MKKTRAKKLHSDLQKEITKLKNKVSQHADNPTWGQVGDLGYVLQQIRQLNQFLGR